MAADPRRLRVLKGLTSCFEGILVANGFVTDIGPGKVFRGRAFFGEGDPVPMISILEAPLPPDQLDGPLDADVNAGRLELIVQGFALDDEANPTDPAHVLLADAKMALAREKRKVNDGLVFGYKWVEKLSIGLGVVRPPDEISSFAYFWLPVTVYFIDDMLNPYSD